MNNKFITVIAPIILLSLLVISVGIYSYKIVKGEEFNQLSPSPVEKLILKPNLDIIKQKNTQDLSAEARNDLAEKLKIEQNEITTREIESIIWNDASLGCPEPGMFYAQVLTPGYKIILEANEKAYEYHSSLRQVKLCP